MSEKTYHVSYTGSDEYDLVLADTNQSARQVAIAGDGVCSGALYRQLKALRYDEDDNPPPGKIEHAVYAGSSPPTVWI